MNSMYPEIGDIIADKYRIERKLGGGGMGTVFSATHLMTGRRFALKWMNTRAIHDNGARERFIREFQAAGSIDHANVVAVLDVGSRDGALYIVMEYLEGESLARRIARGPMPASECVPIVVEAMRGVAAAHRLDIVHRDLKPDNIFICDSPARSRLDVKVLDFGVMKPVNARVSSMPTITARGMAVGTPPYMAPEQVLGLSSMDHRVDVYAFGVILYEALSGRLPFSGVGGMVLLERIVRGGAPPLSQVVAGVPVGLEATVMRALSRDPRRRFAQLADFAACLQPWAAGAGAFGESPPPPVRDSAAPGSLPGGVFTESRHLLGPTSSERQLSAGPGGELLASAFERRISSAPVRESQPQGSRRARGHVPTDVESFAAVPPAAHTNGRSQSGSRYEPGPTREPERAEHYERKASTPPPRASYPQDPRSEHALLPPEAETFAASVEDLKQLRAAGTFSSEAVARDAFERAGLAHESLSSGSQPVVVAPDSIDALDDSSAHDAPEEQVAESSHEAEPVWPRLRNALSSAAAELRDAHARQRQTMEPRAPKTPEPRNAEEDEDGFTVTSGATARADDVPDARDAGAEHAAASEAPDSETLSAGEPRSSEAKAANLVVAALDPAEASVDARAESGASEAAAAEGGAPSEVDEASDEAQTAATEPLSRQWSAIASYSAVLSANDTGATRPLPAANDTLGTYARSDADDGATTGAATPVQPVVNDDAATPMLPKANDDDATRARIDAERSGKKRSRSRVATLITRIPVSPPLPEPAPESLPEPAPEAVNESLELPAALVAEPARADDSAPPLTATFERITLVDPQPSAADDALLALPPSDDAAPHEPPPTAAETPRTLLTGRALSMSPPPLPWLANPPSSSRPTAALSRLDEPSWVTETVDHNIWSIPTELEIRSPKQPGIRMRSKTAVGLVSLVIGMLCSIVWTQWMRADDDEPTEGEEQAASAATDLPGDAPDPATARELTEPAVQAIVEPSEPVEPVAERPDLALAERAEPASDEHPQPVATEHADSAEHANPAAEQAEPASAERAPEPESPPPAKPANAARTDLPSAALAELASADHVEPASADRADSASATRAVPASAKRVDVPASPEAVAPLPANAPAPASSTEEHSAQNVAAPASAANVVLLAASPRAESPAEPAEYDVRPPLLPEAARTRPLPILREDVQTVAPSPPSAAAFDLRENATARSAAAEPTPTPARSAQAPTAARVPARAEQPATGPRASDAKPRPPEGKKAAATASDASTVSNKRAKAAASAPSAAKPAGEIPTLIATPIQPEAAPPPLVVLPLPPTAPASKAPADANAPAADRRTPAPDARPANSPAAVSGDSKSAAQHKTSGVSLGDF